MSNMPFIAFYPAKWLGRCATLSALERGVFITLICEMYERMEPLKNDVKPLARLCGCTPKTLEKALAVLVEDSNKIIMVDGRLWNHRVQKEIEKSQKKSEISKINAQKRWQKDKKNQGSSDAVALRQQSYPEPDLDKDTTYPLGGGKADAQPPKKKAAKGTRISENWKLSQELFTYALAKGLNDGQITIESEKFKNYWLAASGSNAVKRDWDATWRNWIIRAAERSGSQGGAGNSGNARGGGPMSSMVAGFEQAALEGAERDRRERGEEGN